MVKAHGAHMPVIGYGTFRAAGEDCARGVTEALKVGYRAVDTAAGYRNEDKVAEGIRASGVKREDIFITTKVPPEDAEESAFKATVERSLKLLDVDQIDLLLIHWPSRTVPVAKTIATLNACKKAGWTRHIGVSNFTVTLLKEAWAATEAPLVTNQCEYHPYLNQDRLIAACREHGMIFTAYSPIARGTVLDDPVIQRIAREKGVTPAQVVLRWDIQQENVVTIPKSVTPERIRRNFDVFTFTLSGSEMTSITALSQTHKLRVANPSVAPEWDD
jgi:diketogulonate reductase-like aldo/keto reductase